MSGIQGKVSLLEQEKEKKHVVVCYYQMCLSEVDGSEVDGSEKGVIVKDIGSLVCVSVDSLITGEKLPDCEELEKEVELLNPDMNFICTTGVTTGPRLYIFGGYRFESKNMYLLKDVVRYDLHELLKGKHYLNRCKGMNVGSVYPLSVQVGDDRIYVLDYNNNATEPVFYEYNLKDDEWTLVDNTNSDNMDIINKYDCGDSVRSNIKHAPHVVIGCKLHVSLGDSSFTFDTEKRVWGYSKLFNTFWSKLKKKNKKKKTNINRLSQSNFYGARIWERFLLEVPDKCRGGSHGPFGFYGRGIVWDKNILLGVHYSPDSHLVAFLLDDEGKVVSSQPVALDGVDTISTHLPYARRLLDLGQDDYFGFVHLIQDGMSDVFCDGEQIFARMELVTFQVSKTQGGEQPLVECQVVRKDVIARNCLEGLGHFYKVFCV